MSALPETPYAEFWPDAWRFAFLMTGSAAAAQAIIEAVVPKAAERLTQMRDKRQARRWLFSNLRERCRLSPPTVPAADDTEELAQLFLKLPEEERSALALFHLQQFDADELAEVLDLSPIALGRLLGVARQLLGRQNLPAAPPVLSEPSAPAAPPAPVSVPPLAEIG